ncbi:centriole and centriolar satellite protein OFD1 [Gastrophryne carolinensis]
MMSHREQKALTQEELRKRLYQTFKNKGVLDSLKTQLRNQLIQDLKHHAYSKEQQRPSDLPRDSVLHLACNSLVADHLQRCGYEYTLSVFYPECGLQKEKALGICDILQLIKINPNSRLYNTLLHVGMNLSVFLFSQTSSLPNSNAQGLLLKVLTELMDHHMNKIPRDADTQTVTTSPYKESIVDKLKFIDEQFDELYPKHTKFESLEGKLAEYRREMEEQLQQEMFQKLKHFKDVEIAKIKLEEREKSQMEISNMRRELQNTYQSKQDSLVTREKNAIERLQRQQEIESKEVYAQRQSLLKEIEVVRSREIELRQRMEAFELAQKLQEDKNKTIDDFLRKRELEVKNIEDTFEQKLKNELLRCEIELKEEYLKKSQKVIEDERKNREEAARLREDTVVMNMKKQDLEQAISRTKYLEIEVETLRAQLSAVTHQNHQLTDKLKEFADYPLVQEEKVEHQAQVKLLKQQLEQLQRENLTLCEKTSHPSAEFLSLQEELKKLESARKFDQDEFKIQREILEKQLELEMERGLDMKMQLFNREESLKRLNLQVEQLDFQLRQTQQAFKSEYRIPKAPLTYRNALDVPTNKLTCPNASADNRSLGSQRFLDSVVETGGIAAQRHRHLEGTRSSSPDSDLEFVANTKARIKELEKEAEFVEEAFRNYQHRVIHAASIPSHIRATASLSRGYLPTMSNVQQHKVTFLEDNLTPQQHVLLSKIKTQKYERPTSSKGNMSPPQAKKSSARRLSSTPVSKTEIHKETVSLEDNDGSYISSSHQSSNQRLSPIPKNDQPETLLHSVVDLGVENRTGPSYSAHQAAAESLQLTDNSKPEKLRYEDLNYSDSSLQDQEDIPEQLDSDLSHPSEHFVRDTRVAVDVPLSPTSVHDLSRGDDKSESLSHIKMNEESGQSDHQEDKEEPRKTPGEDAYQQEISVEVSKSHKEESRGNPIAKSPEQKSTTVNSHEAHSAVNAPQSEKPLDKYMQLLLQKGAGEQADKATREATEDFSVEERLSNARAVFCVGGPFLAPAKRKHLSPALPAAGLDEFHNLDWSVYSGLEDGEVSEGSEVSEGDQSVDADEELSELGKASDSPHALTLMLEVLKIAPPEAEAPQDVSQHIPGEHQMRTISGKQTLPLFKIKPRPLNFQTNALYYQPRELFDVGIVSS